MISPVRQLITNPYVEVAVRQAYWRVPAVHRRLRNRASAPASTQSDLTRTATTPDEIVDVLAAAGVHPGDMVIVHSRDAALADSGVNPRELNDALIAYLESAGTLALPAFPRFKDEPTGMQWMHERTRLPTMRFDLRRSRPTSGLLGWDLTRRPNAVRSRFPVNNLVAFGAQAESMFVNELDGSLPTACGPNSGWAHLWRHNAKIVMLGVDVAHTLTMNHVSEDSFEEEWPIMDWYRERHAVIIDEGTETDLIIRERRPKWAMHYAEGKLNRDLRDSSIVRDTAAGGLPIAVLSAARHLEFLSVRRSRAYPYFLLPRGDWKRRRP